MINASCKVLANTNCMLRYFTVTRYLFEVVEMCSNYTWLRAQSSSFYMYGSRCRSIDRR